VAARLAASGRNVLVLDNLSRPGTEHNLIWLSRRFPRQVQALVADVRDEEAVCYAVNRSQRVFHFAAQVAVTTSLAHPQHDHQVNATGTLNVLEALRRHHQPPPLLFTSTNKVYGELADIALQLTAAGYRPLDPAICASGIDERRPLALCSPYGCSKGAADQYVLDYARSYGLPAVVFRMSCIYGPHQFGNEDQGWVAHFVRQALTDGEITLYGDGYQIRDVLFVDDLAEAALQVLERLPATAGEVFNIGGGVGQVISLNGLLQLLSRLQGTTPKVQFEDWRPSDQRYYVSDSTKLYRATGWRPQVSVEQGVRRLYDWMRAQVCSAGSPANPAPGRVAL
ncbi:MAG TPA: NAD-dependent epimerase/dehydratase family protein, partial [Nitrococcus sp.]|nr:NAD-dependent epimerase/dehydratase family protein [Nitrococcus sp.]